MPNSLGFGHFSTAEDENRWRTYAYDGLEGTTSSVLGKITNEEMLEMQETLASLCCGNDFQKNKKE